MSYQDLLAEKRAFRERVLEYAARTNMTKAARHFNVSAAQVRDWARYDTRKARMTDETLEVPEAVDTTGVTVEETTRAIVVDSDPPAELVARTADTEAVDALTACFTRIKNSAATAPLKEVIAATRVLGEIVLAAGITNTPLAKRLAAAAESVDRR